MECKYGWNNCCCCEEIDNVIYPCKWEEDNYMNVVENSNKINRKVKHKRNYHNKGCIRERNRKYKNHLKFLFKNVSRFPCPVLYTDKIYIDIEEFIDNPKPYYKRCYRDNHKGGRYKYYKKYSNRCVRRYKGEIHSKGNQYRKIFDYWYTVD